MKSESKKVKINIDLLKYIKNINNLPPKDKKDYDGSKLRK
jgi:hypothetical protein